MHTQAKQSKDFIHGQAGVQPLPKKQGFMTHDADLGRQTSSFQMFSHSFFFFPCFICWTWCHVLWNVSLGRWSDIFQLCPFPASCAAQAPPWWGGMRSRNGVDSVHTLLSSNEKLPGLLIVASTNTKCSPVCPIMKKIICLSSKTSTDRYKSKRLIPEENLVCFHFHRFNIRKILIKKS